MPLYVKDAEVDSMAERLAALRRVTKTEAVRQALSNELERESGEPSYVERILALSRALREKGNPETGKPIDKEFIDSLYE